MYHHLGLVWSRFLVIKRDTSSPVWLLHFFVISSYFLWFLIAVRRVAEEFFLATLVALATRALFTVGGVGTSLPVRA